MPERQDPPRVERVDDAVVPEPRRREVRRALALVGLEDRRLEGVARGVVVERPADRREHPRRLLAAHDGDPRSSATSTGTAAGTRGRPSRSCRRRSCRRSITVNFGTSAQATAITILAPSFAIPPASYSRPTMKPVMFWRNTSGIFRWRGELDEVGAFQRRRAEQDAVVGDDPDRVAVDVGEAASRASRRSAA